ncbi:hypothetical protein KVR01_013724 [Diaporthe batatas]|uniref:uncharacterized protein n=1 Tax=Diaporthe batatas TaxID=748121 RepID=UPI001D04887F|nr:uncharacterized protein KVR01_013724 [Diaporthe batatas]KAG8156383.1 hypothetical protein KVR01_013724 [Diaporthe batatas]
MSQASLQFGIEIELLLGGRKKAHSSWKSLANDLSKRLTAVGIANHVNDGGDKSIEHYREYSLVREVTIPNQLGKGLWGIELVSPVYPATWSWAVDMELIFSTIRRYFILVPSPHCSTHIHVSATPLPLSPIELSALAKAALYFEPAVDQLVPADRRASNAYWCQSNRASVALRSMSLQECLVTVDAAWDLPATSSNTELFDRSLARALVGSMNLFPASSTYGRAHGKKHDFVRGKVYKWDFSRMLPRPSSSSKGSATGPTPETVEFRQPPGSCSAEDAKGWITLVLALVAGATKTTSWAPLSVTGMQGGSIGELWALVVTGASVLGWDGVGDAAVIFSRRNA